MSFDALLPRPLAPPTDTFRLGTVTQLDPLRVTLDGDTLAADVTPINTAGPVIVGDRVWCQIHGKALVVVSSVTSGARDLYLRNFQKLLSGGGIRMGSTTGVRWTQRLIGLGGGRGPLALSGYWNIEQPPDGTVIPMHGHTSISTGVTVANGYVPLGGWQALWYDPPVGRGEVSQPDRFHVTSYGKNFDVPPTWILLCHKNADTNSYIWADGRETALWTYPSPSSPWSNYGLGYTSLCYKRENGVVYLEGLIKGSTSTSTGTIFTLPAGYRPAGGTLIFLGHASGGITDLRVYTSGTVAVSGFLAGGNANDVSLSGISFPADQ